MTIANGTCGDNLTWVLNDDYSLVITGSGAMDNYALVSNVPWYQYITNIISVTLPSGITSIGDLAFNGCTALTSVTIPSGVTSIGGNAFEGCSALTSVSIPNTVTSIGGSVFRNCTSLTSLTIPDGVTSISYRMCYNCTALTSITIPNSITAINNYAFSGCTSLTAISLGDQISNIYSSAFQNCPSLTRIELQSVPASIGTNAFSLGTSTHPVTCVVESPGNIANGALNNYKNNYTTFSYRSIGEYVGEDGLTYTFLNNELSITGTGSSSSLVDGLLTLSDDTQVNMRSMTSCTIGSNVTAIQYGAFRYCTALSAINVSVNNQNLSSENGVLFNKTKTILLRCPLAKNGVYSLIPNTVTTIAIEAFYGCASLTAISIPSTVSTLSPRAFGNCSSLTSISLPSGMTSIEEGMFSGCTSLPSITIPSTVTVIGDSAFFQCSSLAAIEIPTGVTSIGEFAFNNCTSLTAVEIPANVTTIGGYAFGGCTSLGSLTLPSSITTIGGGAFAGCSALSDLTASLDVYLLNTSNPSGTWAGCTGLRSLTVTGSTSAHAHIYTTTTASYLPWQLSKEVFTSVKYNEGCTATQHYIFMGCTQLKTVDLPSTLTSLGTQTFYGCTGLTHLHLPINISAVSSAFEYCSGLEYVHFRGTSGVDYNISNYTSLPWYQSRESLTAVVFDTTVTAIGNFTFYGCSKITQIDIANVVTIGMHAFDGCTDATTLILGNVTTIGSAAFQNCTHIGQTLNLPSSLTTIGENAFKNCTSLVTAIIPSSVTLAGASIFENCTSLNVVSFDIKISTTGNTTTTFKGCTSLQYVTITNSTNIVSSKISTEMFMGCTALQTLDLPSQCSQIAARAFKGCTSLQEINNGDSVVQIGAGAFEGCISLETLPRDTNTSGSIGDEAFKGCTSLTTLETHPTATISIGTSSFEGCTGITNISFNAAFSSIGDNAFEGCTGVKQIMFKKALGTGTIGNLSFSLGTAEDEVTATVFSLGNWAASSLNTSTVKGSHTTFNFYPLAVTGVDGLTYTFGGNGILEVTNGTGSPISMTAISYCTLTDSNHNTIQIGNLVTDLVLGASIPSISNNAFYTTSESSRPALATFTYTDSSFTIGQRSFSNCTGLTSVIASTPNSTITIGESGFEGCTSLTSFDQAGDVSALNAYAFKGCSHLTTFDATSVTEIPSNVFNGCSMLDTISFNNNTTSIGDNSFFGCISLFQIDLPGSLQSIGAYAFSGCTSLQSITIPEDVMTIGAGTFKNCTSLSSITVDPDNPYFTSEDGVLFSKTKDILLRYPPAKPNADYVIPTSVYSIKETAFESNTSISNVTLPDNLGTIENEGFRNCSSLREIILPSNLTIIGQYAFAECYSLIKITFIRQTQTSPGNLAFALGVSGHEAECLVESPNNWAQSNISEHPNQWTTLTFKASYYEATDGLRYSFDGSTLQVSGSGPSISLAQGRIALTSGNFLDVTAMTAAVFEEGITGLVSQSMMHCQNLVSVSLPQTMTTIPAETFKGCTSLKNILLPRNISTIPIDLFYNCVSLEKIIIPQNVSSINYGAYARCHSTKELIFYGNEPTISTNEEKPFAMGTATHEAYVTVQSFDNWAESANLEQYSNEYTHFTYKNLVLIGSDGLTYKVENNTLYVDGKGAMTSLANRVLTTQGGTVTLPVAKSAVIGAGITSISTNALKEFGLELMTFRSASLNGGDIVEGDYSDALWNNVIQPRTYVYGDGVWLSLDSVPFVIVFSPGGGKFTASTVPSVNIKTTSIKEDNGKIDTTQHETSFKELIPYQTADGVETYLWYYISETVIGAELQVQNLPTVSNGGITPPTGFASIRAWETVSPYHLFNFTDDETPVYDEQSLWKMTIERPTTDSMKHIVAYPFWKPDRGDRLRALITAPGLGALDFENIQSVSTTYNSNLSVVPIVCYGHKGTFCMDLGVTKTIDISYLRVSPKNPVNDSYDSRLWDNATWIKRLRDFTDRWQLRTNGCTFYLKRPNNPRLANGFNDSDPMINFIGEINGENCYITSTPIKYAEGMPYAIKSTLSLKMGTLYPKQVPTNMTQVILKWGGPDDPWVQDMTYYLQYPKNMLAVVPSMPGKWSLYDDGTHMSYAYEMYIIKDGKESTLSPGEYFDPTAPTGQESLIIYSRTTTIGDNGMGCVLEAGERTFTITPYPNATTVTISVWMVGGGGGGGGGYAYHYESSFTDYYECAGGAGGASGRYGTASYDLIRGTYTLIGTVGAGGAKGTSYQRYGGGTLKSGSNGGTTSFIIKNADNEIVARSVPIAGGTGGPAATDNRSPGVWGESQSTDDQYASYHGGNGGARRNSMGAYANDGTDGYCFNKGTPQSENTYGYGGRNTAVNGYYLDVRLGGGGGGGGSINIRGIRDENYRNLGNRRFGGQGTKTSDQDNRDGIYGGGGGGGSALWTSGDMVLQDGGKGGDGVLFIIVKNGTIS